MSVDWDDIGEWIKTAYEWREHNFPGRFTNIYGEDIYSCLGLPLGKRCASIFGADIRFCLDPIGLIGAFGSHAAHGPLASAVLDTLEGAGGGTSYVLGRFNSLVYGVKRDFHRGAMFKFHCATGGPSVLAPVAFSLLITASTLGSAILADIYKNNSSWTHPLNEWGLGGIPDRLLAYLLTAETKVAIAIMAVEKAAAAADKTKLASTVDVSLLPNVLADAKREAEQVAQLAIEAVDAEKRSSPNRRELIDGCFEVRAKDIELVGRTSPDGGPGWPESSTITVNAVGTEPEENGTLILQASKQASMSAGPAAVQVVRTAEVGTVVASAGPLGTVFVRQGELLTGSRMMLGPEGIIVCSGVSIEGSAINMTPETMRLSVGAPGVGASIDLSVEGLTLSFGIWSLSMTEAGITLSVGENSMNFSPQGVVYEGLNADNVGQVAQSVGGASLAIMGDAQVGVQGAIVQIA